jgi:hypothetical protein
MVISHIFMSAINAVFIGVLLCVVSLHGGGGGDGLVAAWEYSSKVSTAPGAVHTSGAFSRHRVWLTASRPMNVPASRCGSSPFAQNCPPCRCSRWWVSHLRSSSGNSVTGPLAPSDTAVPGTGLTSLSVPHGGAGSDGVSDETADELASLPSDYELGSFKMTSMKRIGVVECPVITRGKQTIHRLSKFRIESVLTKEDAQVFMNQYKEEVKKKKIIFKGKVLWYLYCAVWHFSCSL